MRRRQVVIGTALAASRLAWASASDKTPFVLASVTSGSDTFASRWLALIYNDAFGQLGLPLEIRAYPAARAAVEAAAGNVDGELVRGPGYDTILLQVPEPTVISKITAYALRDNIVLSPGWDSLRNTPYRVEYRLGYSVMGKRLAAVVPPDRLGTVRNAETGLRKLAVGRIDLFVDNYETVESILRRPEFASAGIHAVSELERMPVYAYLHPRHANLLEPLGAILKKMRESGQIERYRRQALHQN
jgi:hypothetical protein